MSLDGITGEENIASLWKSHYQTLFNSVGHHGTSLTSDVHPTVETDYDSIRVSSEEIRSAIIALDNNKSCGPDGVYAEHLKYSSNLLLDILSEFFTSFMVHGFLPESMMSVTLVPIIKDKAEKITTKDNYRPIALASIVSKLLERILLNRMTPYLSTNCNQFGFKPKHGTDQCIYMLKDLIDSYIRMNSSVFTCFLDASKAFDRVCHNKLFEKLTIRGVPSYILRILKYWYASQTFFVRWGNTVSESFTVSNGVRQGGILSPYLFNIYMDNLSDNLNKVKIGCYSGEKLINHLMYADDLVVMAPSSAGLSRLLEKCEDYGTEHCIKFNPIKSAVIIFRSKLLTNIKLPTFSLNNQTIKEVNDKKYLGHIISSDSSDELDIGRQRRQLYLRGNTLLRKFHMCNLDTKISLFRTYCTSLYTAHIWCKYSRTTINRFYTSYHNILKMFLGLSKYESTSMVCTLFDVQCCQAVIRRLVYSFMNRLQASGNSLIIANQSSDRFHISSMRTHWNKLLYV